MVLGIPKMGLATDCPVLWPGVVHSFTNLAYIPSGGLVYLAAATAAK